MSLAHVCECRVCGATMAESIPPNSIPLVWFEELEKAGGAHVEFMFRNRQLVRIGGRVDEPRFWILAEEVLERERDERQEFMRASGMV
ncbi:MAG: hypothetical protein ACYDAE_29095 [Steroidobacteraceae bacterium]